jgi:predicted secreted hydrolase
VKRRDFLAASLLCAAGSTRAAEYPQVVGVRALRFPRDHGSHPEFRTEWWYVTGWLDDGRGFQVTFFRNRSGLGEDNPSRFTPRQLLFAHAAIADPALGRLAHDQRAARAGFGLAEASSDTTDVVLEDWRLALEGESYRCRIAAREFTLALDFTPRQPILLQGEGGFSRKGSALRQASYYYSRPHLAASGTLEQGSSNERVSGEAWLDHEWSSEYLAREAAGWDWTGLNLADGGALMLFRIRAREGGVFWAGGTHRAADGATRTFAPQDVRFETLRHWRSPRTGITYPVAMRIAAAELAFELEPLLNDQELDARATTGTIYWEGAVRVRDQRGSVGRGYLELTGYGKPLTL